MVGLKPAVTPAGSPETLKLTVPVKPPIAPTAMLAVVLPLGATDTEDGAESEKSEIFRLIDAELVWLPLTPVTVKVWLPMGAPLPVKVNMDEPEPFTVLGLKPAVTPVGSPATLKPTVPAKPLSPVTAILAVALPVGFIGTEAGADSEKLEAVNTPMLNVTEAVSVMPPLVPVMVKV